MVGDEKLLKDGSCELTTDVGLALTPSERVEEVGDGDLLLWQEINSHEIPNHAEETLVVKCILACLKVLKSLAYGQLKLKLNRRAQGQNDVLRLHKDLCFEDLITVITKNSLKVLL